MNTINRSYNALIKTVSFFLAVLGLLAVLFSACGIIALAQWDGYSKSATTMLQDQMERMANNAAIDIADIYAQERYEPDFRYNWSEYYSSYEGTNYRYTITDFHGRELTSNYEDQEVLYTITTDVFPRYLQFKYEQDAHGNEHYYEEEIYLEHPWVVTSYILKDMEQSDPFSLYYHLGSTLHAMRYWLIALVAIGLVVTLCAVIYLLFAAGRRPGKADIQLNFFDKLPGDLYFGAVIGLSFLAAYLMHSMLDYHYWGYYDIDTILACLAIAAVVAALWVVYLSFMLTIATRLKKGEGYIWRRTVIFWCLGLCWRLVNLCWRGIKYLGRGFRKLFQLLPLVWQWLILGGILLFVFFLGAAAQAPAIYLAGCVIWLILTLYLAMSFGLLQKHIQAMAQGDLDRKVPTRGLHGNFLMMAQDVNSLSAGAEAEVERRMRSERMKTELITNVSHDIKTPLTSIVTYVDLLQKPHTLEEGQEYLKVLARQSQRLKKLTEDLVEMSKASSGNIAVNLEKTNMVELIDQALAEYEAKMERASLQVVKRLPGMELIANADGRLFWRVMDNLLGNCVKYAMPGTRVYVDAASISKGVVVSVRNISAEALNISADELMERFVRGDRSRNTEGSGLGLNIAKTLMELQQGSLVVDVDGDLFKVVLTLKGSAGGL